MERCLCVSGLADAYDVLHVLDATEGARREQNCIVNLVRGWWYKRVRHAFRQRFSRESCCLHFELAVVQGKFANDMWIVMERSWRLARADDHDVVVSR